MVLFSAVLQIFLLIFAAALIFMGDQMNKKTSFDLPDQKNKKDNLSLPSFTGCVESVLQKGELLEVAGTNVVRVPFGVRQPKKQRPAKLSTWATLVLPIQSFDSPTPPPHAA